MGERSKLKLFSAELQSFSNTKTLESSSERGSEDPDVSLIKHTQIQQVVIQKIDLGNDKEQHWIVVLNESGTEVVYILYAYIIDNRQCLFYGLDDDLHKWLITEI